ncbi:hypothetical protein KGQ71_00880 [Patescibacteria group bacterium]|nr:hypothetical protein [Patescibacteria group bacterium]
MLSLRSHTVRQASALLVITALLSNVLGLVRNLIFYRFINRADLDVYYTSFRVSDFLFNVLIFGAITSAVIPILTGLLNRKKNAQAAEVTNQLLSWATVVLIIVMAILYFLMPFIIGELAPHFDAGRQALTVRFSRLLLLQTLFFSWSFILGSLLNGYRRFATYSFAPLVYNLSIIIGGIMARQHGIAVVIYAVVAGAFLHFLIQYLELRMTGYRVRFDLRFTNELRTILQLMWPRGASQGATQTLLSVYNSLGSGLQKGSITIFNGINDLQTTPTVIVANSLATACFPALSAQAGEQQWTEMNALLTKAFRLTLFILLPILAFSLILRAQIIRLYFGISGASWELTIIAISTFIWFMISTIPSSLVVVLSRIFYATRDAKTPMYIAIVTSALGIAISYVGVTVLHFSVATFAFSEMTIAFCQFFAYFFILYRRNILHLSFRSLAGYGLNYGIGSLILAATAWATLHIVDSIYVSTGWISTTRVIGLMIQGVLAGLVGIAAYFGYSTIRSKEELGWVKLRGSTLRR